MEEPTAAREGEKIQVVVVDDHNFFRQGLRDLLGEQDLEVVGEAATGEAALKMVEATAPDVVVMDLNMPGMGGVEATRRLTAAAPRTRVLVLTIAADGGHVIEALMAGACGYLLKDASVEEIVSGIRAAAAGESLISPPIASKLLTRLRADQQEAAEEAMPEQGRADLSERELEVLKLLAAGKDNSEIAQELFISPKTVKNHISSILAKLQIENRIQAAVYAVRSGIV
jgi:two-component system, NarL family, response regulator LiaR